MLGTRLAHYQIVETLGQGGMGVVYLARDTHLDRLVALKVLPPEQGGDAERMQRFRLEARAASALNNPHIVTVYEIDTDNGVAFIVMEYLPGKTLGKLIPAGGMPPQRALDLAIQIAEALVAAHAAGILHRDLKPSNIIVDDHGFLKILDFGLAKLTGSLSFDGRSSAATVADQITGECRVLGTVAYMSPEQAEGKPVDAGTDIFSFGAVVYEMVTGQPAFRGDSFASLLAAVLKEEPSPPRVLARDVPKDLNQIILRSLAKRREDRFPSVLALLDSLRKCRADLDAVSAPINYRQLVQQSKRTGILLPTLIICFALLGVLAMLLVKSVHVHWARTEAIPEIERLIDKDQFGAAFVLAEKAEKYIPNDPALTRFWRYISRNVSVITTPPGAEVYRTDYNSSGQAWIHVGASPLRNLRVPRGLFRWKITKKGYETREGSLFPNPYWVPVDSVNLHLDEASKAPAGMVHVPVGNAPLRLQIPGLEDVHPVSLNDYWIDRYEVTNRQFKQFVDAGGYRTKQWWDQPFVKQGRILPWEEAMALFRDATNRPGPLGWMQGDYPAGQAEYPVSGVSWYEAAAYAKFAGKVLPNIWQWNHAAGTMSSTYLVPASNFGGQGPSAVGSHRGLGPFGTYDMAGNVKEWCWNAADPGKRYILGGAWNDPPYMFTDVDAYSPFDRQPTFGFRCARDGSPLGATAAMDPVPNVVRHYDRETPVSEQVFRAYRDLYSYDKKPLAARLDAVDETNPNWKKEKISFAAAYGNERVTAYLFLPKTGKGPLQTIVFFPGSYAILNRSSVVLNDIPMFDFILKSGRAVLYPIYKGTYERGDDLVSDFPDTSSGYRDHVVQWSKDLGRSLDYIRTRSELDSGKTAYFGLSWGAALGAILPAVDPRFKTVILHAGGFYLQHAKPEVDAVNFAPRVKVPVLMLNGRYDYDYPPESAQLPLYRGLGTPAADKRYLLYDAAHTIPMNELIKESLEWLDHYLGPAN